MKDHLSALPLFFMSLLAACSGGSGEEQVSAIADPSAASTTVQLFGGTLQADGQRVLRTPTAEEMEHYGAAAGDQLETVLFKTLAIEGGPTLVFHATYLMQDGMRQDCRACTMTLSASAFAHNADGSWTKKAIQPYFADVSAAYEELPVEALSVGQGSWLLQHESCWCGAGGDCMCTLSWYVLDDVPGWFKPVLSQEYHQYVEEGMTSLSEEVVAKSLGSSDHYADLEVLHSYTNENMKTGKKKTREERATYTFDAAKGMYMPKQ